MLVYRIKYVYASASKFSKIFLLTKSKGLAQISFKKNEKKLLIINKKFDMVEFFKNFQNRHYI